MKKTLVLSYFLTNNIIEPYVVPIQPYDTIYTSDLHQLAHIAVLTESLEILRIVLIAISRTDLINSTTKDGNTPLHYAVSLQNMDLVQLLLQYSADPLQLNNKKDTPFHLALNSNLEIARIIGNYLLLSFPEDLYKFIHNPYIQDSPILDVFQKLKRTDIVDLVQNLDVACNRLMIDGEFENKTRCSFKGCPETKMLRKCFLCKNDFCPRHLTLHVHNDNVVYMVNRT